MSWRRLSADGVEWEVRAIAADTGTASSPDEQVLEFRAIGAIRPPRRVVVTGSLEDFSDDELFAVYRRALPIGGDHYGRPGKRMADT
jgi:hypothetical protein